MVKLIDKNGNEIKNKFLLKHEDGDTDVAILSGLDWYIQNLDSTKGSLFPVEEFPHEVDTKENTLRLLEYVSLGHGL